MAVHAAYRTLQNRSTRDWERVICSRRLAVQCWRYGSQAVLPESHYWQQLRGADTTPQTDRARVEVNNAGRSYRIVATSGQKTNDKKSSSLETA